jgi:MGT family glycosyltransferase
MKIIWMNVPAHGHVNPTLPVVEGLVGRGFELSYYNREEFRAKISATGADFRAYPPNGMTPDAITQALNVHLVNMTRLLFETSLTLTEFMLDEIAREEPDSLIFDSVCLWGMQAARLSGLPSVASITTFVLEGAKLGLSWRDYLHMIGGALPRVPRLLAARQALVKRYGRASLPPKHIFPCTGDLNILYTIPELQPSTAVINDTFRFVGPSLPATPQDLTFHLPEGRVIYISLGTIHTNNARFYTTCFEAFAGAPGTFVLVAGALADQLSPPANFIVRSRVPQVALLPRVDLFITHTGINSLHESLYFGVPMVMIPQQMEQAMNARIAEMHHLGVILGKNPPYGQQVSATELDAAVERVLGDPSYGAAAERMKLLLQATGGTAQAINAIVEFGTKFGIEFDAVRSTA